MPFAATIFARRMSSLKNELPPSMIVSPDSSFLPRSSTVASVGPPAGTMTQMRRGFGIALIIASSESAPVAPSDASCFTASALRSYATIVWPFFMSRRAMLAPIRPSPIIPSCMWLLFSRELRLRSGNDIVWREAKLGLQFLERRRRAERPHRDHRARPTDVTLPAEVRSLLDDDARVDRGWQDRVAVCRVLLLEQLPRWHRDDARLHARGDELLVRADAQPDLGPGADQDDLGLIAIRDDVGALVEAGGRRVLLAIEHL